MKIYTKTGDKGETSLFGGKRVLKSHLRVEAYGTMDELNSAIGVAVAEMQSEKRKAKNKVKLKAELIGIQEDLFELCFMLAAPTTKRSALGARRFENRVKEFERMIDEMTGKLPELRNFILPGGSKTGALLHFVRTVSRRAERRIVQLSAKEKVDEEVLIYFNRLSDLLFTMARYANQEEKQKEAIWKRV